MEGSQDDRSLRASDDDRERVADVLRQAAADGRLTLAELQDRLEALYAAKTYGELEPVVSDLPRAGLPRPSSAASPPAVTESARVPDRVGGTPVSRAAKAVFGGATRRGQRVVPTDNNVKAVFGGVELDLREFLLESHEIRIAIPLWKNTSRSSSVRSICSSICSMPSLTASSCPAWDCLGK